MMAETLVRDGNEVSDIKRECKIKVASSVEYGPRRERKRHDVFLSYRSDDRERVIAVSRLLSARGVRAFLDRSDLVAGLPWPQALEDALRSVRAVLVFVGGVDSSESLGFWQRREAWFALDRQAEKEGEGESFPVIPVLLPGARPDSGFLFLNTWVDLREAASEPAAVEAIVNAVNNIGDRRGNAVPVAICPYRALETFREEHAALFFGRESFADDLLNRVTHRPLVALVGPSGSGKSSVVQAGLIPLLRRQRPPEASWDAVVFRPGDGPFYRLAASLIPLLEPEADEIAKLEMGRKLGDKLCAGAIRIEDVINRLIAKSNGTGRLLLVADQFEELFTLSTSSQRQSFVTAALSALEGAPFTLLLVLRADFYGHAIALDRRLSDNIQTGLVNLGPMTRDELRRAVEQPAGKVDIHFEPGLVDRVLDHVELQPGGLPLLEFALTQLWERRENRKITHAAYEAIGEVAGAISQRAETVFLTLDDSQRRGALSLFTRLLRVAAPFEAEPDTRRRVEVDALNESERSVLQPFVDARLLVLDRPQSAGKHTVEVAHEALIHGWNRLGKWVDQKREFLLWRQRLGQSLAHWQNAGRDKTALLRGPALREAVTWFRDHKAELSPPEDEFIRRSRKRELRRRRSLVAAIALAILIVGAWPIFSLVTETNTVLVWTSMRLAPLKLVNARPSRSAEWVHAVSVAGRLDEIGSAIFKFPSPDFRLKTLGAAAILMAVQGRTAEANRLADRALEAAKDIAVFDSSAYAQLDVATLLREVGRPESARPFALRALAIGRQEKEPETRAMAVADAARILAGVGLEQEARTAIEEARPWIDKASSTAGREFIGNLVAEALVQLGAVDEALTLVSGRSGWPVPPALVQKLVDRGYLQKAYDLVAGSDNPFTGAVLASALASAGRTDEAKALAQTVMAQLETVPMGLDSRDLARAQFQQHLLLRVFSASEAIALVRERGNPDEMASFATVLARSRNTEFAREMARDAAKGAAVVGKERARVLLKIADAFARSGRAEMALSTARSIEESETRAAGLAHAAYGFASEGQTDRAQALVREVTQLLPSISDRDRQSLVWAILGLTHVRFGNYSAALKDDGLTLDPSDEVAVYTAIIRDDALRRNAALQDLLDRRPVEGLGRFALHWP